MWVVEVNVLGRRFSCTVDSRRRPQPDPARMAPWRDRMHRQSGAAA
ncbi:hypothetical protein [Mycolicibacterium hodleri]|nr:hypothetical protein [Mycolicibacterium hodleri]